jgi:dTDP-4-dehydrorhamnose reductase
LRFLVIGAGGQLGTDLLALLPSAVGLTRSQLSVTDRDSLREAVRGFDAVFNCAADNAVDAAEADPSRAFAVNADGAGNVAWACRLAGARLVHFSTNYVFDGSGSRPFTEADRPQPRGAYARSKLEGERLALQELPEALVVRSSGLFGVTGSSVKGGSFPERIARRAQRGERLQVVADQRLNPTYTADLARAVVELVEHRASGLLHVVAQGCCSFWELAVETVRLAGLSVPVEKLSSASFSTPAPRPLNGCLASLRTEPLRPWQEGLAAWWAAWSSSLAFRSR